MELVKKQLEENGYAYFNMNDYDMFTDDLKNYSKYICNESNNLKEYINGIRVDVIAKDEFKHEFESGKMQIQKEFLIDENEEIHLENNKNKNNKGIVKLINAETLVKKTDSRLKVFNENALIDVLIAKL